MSIVSSLLGLDASHNAGVAQNQANQQTAKANAYGDTASAIYAGLNLQGGNQAQPYQHDYLNLLNRQGAYAGLGPNTINTGGNPNVGAPGLRQPGGTPGPSMAGQPQQQDPNNPYSLDQYQQQKWNQTAAGIAQSAKSAIASFQEQMARSGITDPRAIQVGTEQLTEHFAAVHADEETKFYEQVKADKQKALDAITQGLKEFGTQGISEQEAAASGNLGLQGGAANQALTQQNLSAQQQQLAASQQAALINAAAKAFGYFGPTPGAGSGGGDYVAKAYEGYGTGGGSDLPASGAK